jgi:hypothetical protein
MMGREVRMVPASWQHPVDADGNLQPLLLDQMPCWGKQEANHYMMYETCTEGTPISPAMESPEILARWLADNNASAFGELTASYEQWLGMIERGSCVSAIIQKGILKSGVEVSDA